ncbi:uncharacterized protein ACRADG_009977 [Cochliomyia hominivorax]
MSIPDAKTPFPRHADPVAAADLYKRLQETLDRANRMMRASSTGEDDLDEFSTSSSSLSQYDEEHRRAEFYKKRKQFIKSEYIIAQQKAMSAEIPEPGPSVGDNWRIEENESNALYKIPSNMVMTRSHSHRYQSTLEYDVLREITDQLSESSEQEIV